MNRFDKEIEKIKINYPKVLFLEKHTEKQLLDKWLNDRCHQLKYDEDAPQNIFNELKKFKRRKKLLLKDHLHKDHNGVIKILDPAMQDFIQQ